MTDLHKAAQQALGYPSLYDITGDIKGLNTLLVPVEEVKQLEEMNRQLREQNTSLDAECGRLEAENAALREALAKPVVPASFTDEDMKASWLTGFKEAEFQFRGGTEKSGEFPAKTPLSVAPQAAPPKQPSVPPGYALVPVAALKWLHGEEGEFDCPPEGYFRGKPAPYWWRSVFRKMCADAPQPKDKP